MALSLSEMVCARFVTCRPRGRRPLGTLGLIAALLGAPTLCFSEVVERRPAETDETFAMRVVGGSADLAHPVVRSIELVPGKVTLIAFVDDHRDQLTGHLFVATSPSTFEHLSFPSCESEGGLPDVAAVFFARTSKGGPRDLGVLCVWSVRHFDVNGELYAARFYGVQETGAKVQVEPRSDLAKKFETDALVRRAGARWRQATKAAFTTVAQVKKRLRSMGIEP